MSHLVSCNHQKQRSGRVCDEYWLVWHYSSSFTCLAVLQSDLRKPGISITERQNPDRAHFGRVFGFSSAKHRELGRPPSTQLFSILGRSCKSRESNFTQPTFLPLPTNELHVRQKAQEIARTCSKTHQSGNPYQCRRWFTRLQSRDGH